MKTNLVSITGMCVLAAFLTGCAGSHHAATRKMVAGAVSVGVMVGAAQDPNIIPYLRAAAPVVCEASRGTNALPQHVIDQLNANEAANSLKTPLAVAIWNSAFGIYEGLYADYLAEPVANKPDLMDWLGGVCDGILAGLPPTAVTTKQEAKLRAVAAKQLVKLPPHVDYP